MKDKKKVFPRILKEVGRLALIVLTPYFFTGVFSALCFHNHVRYGIHLSTCMRYSRIVFFSCFIALGIVLLLLVYRKKISKLWLAEFIVFYTFLFAAGFIIDYITRQEVEPYPSEVRDVVEEYKKMGVRE